MPDDLQDLPAVAPTATTTTLSPHAWAELLAAAGIWFSPDQPHPPAPTKPPIDIPTHNT